MQLTLLCSWQWLCLATENEALWMSDAEDLRVTLRVLHSLSVFCSKADNMVSLQKRLPIILFPSRDQHWRQQDSILHVIYFLATYRNQHVVTGSEGSCLTATNVVKSLMWISKHIDFWLLCNHPVWTIWYKVKMEIKATFIMILLVPYFWWSDQWSWNGLLVKRNKLIRRFVTFDLFKWPANQAGS